MKRSLFAIIIVLLLNCIGYSQSSITFTSAYSRMKHSSLNGLYFSNNLGWGDRDFRIKTGFDLNYAFGNRNINEDVPGIVEVRTNYSDTILIPWNRSEGDSPMIVLPPMTSNTFQFTLTLSGEYHFPHYDRLSVYGGVYFTYVNKSYLVTYLTDVDISVGEIDFVIPYHIRYLDIGPFIGADFRIWDFEKLSLGLSSSYYFGFKKNGWFNLGFYTRFKLK